MKFESLLFVRIVFLKVFNITRKNNYKIIVLAEMESLVSTCFARREHAIMLIQIIKWFWFLAW